MRRIAVLGATGSIGRQTLDVVRSAPDQFHIQALTAHANADALFALVREFRPEAAGLRFEPERIPEDLRSTEWFFGENFLTDVLEAAQADDVLSAVVGIAGLPAALKALEVSHRLLLANKEALVTGGRLVMEKAKRMKRQVVPVDSEHSAIFQCLQAAGDNPVERIILTASGGPFRTWNKERVFAAQVSDALGHPTWKMGPKITVDCASMMNKGLEVIEAHHLFGTPLDQIDVVVHPESIIHSMIEFKDGAVLAQMGLPDMRVPIGYALGYPSRVPFGGERLDLAKMGRLTFEQPDIERFPCLQMAYDAQRAGGVAPVALNGSNEAAVSAFLSGRIPFGGIAEVNADVLERTKFAPIACPEDVYEADCAARALAEGLISARFGA